MKLSEATEKVNKQIAELILSSWKNLKPIPLKFEDVKQFLIEATQIKNYLKIFEKSMESGKIAIVSPRGMGRSQFGVFLSEIFGATIITPLLLPKVNGKIILDDAEAVLSGDAPDEVMNAFREKLQSIICIITDGRYSHKASELGFKPMSYHIIFQPEKTLKEFLKHIATLSVATEKINVEFADKILKILSPLTKVLVKENETIKEILRMAISFIDEAVRKQNLINEIYSLRRQRKDVVLKEVIRRIKGRFSFSYAELNISDVVSLKIDDFVISVPIEEIIEISNELDFGRKLKAPKSLLIAALIFDSIKEILLRGILIALLLRLSEKTSDLGLEERISILSKAWLIALGYPEQKRVDVNIAIKYFNDLFSDFKIVKLFNSVLEALSREGLIKKGKILEFTTSDFDSILITVKKEILFRAKLFL